MQKPLWWAYLHTDGDIHPKRFFSDEDLLEADESPFVKERTAVFEADSYDEAFEIGKERLLKNEAK